jgi:hypothetical protein
MTSVSRRLKEAAMPHSSRLSIRRLSATRIPIVTAALGILLLGLPDVALGQFVKWSSTDDHYDAATVTSHLDQIRGLLAERHGPLAETLFAMNADLAATPGFFESYIRGPHVEAIRGGVEAAHLVHYQAANGGTLGAMHGTTEHPLNVGWVPHSMFAQAGRLYGEWGHARLLAAVDAHAERHRD